VLANGRERKYSVAFHRGKRGQGGKKKEGAVLSAWPRKSSALRKKSGPERSPLEREKGGAPSSVVLKIPGKRAASGGTGPKKRGGRLIKENLSLEDGFRGGELLDKEIDNREPTAASEGGELKKKRNARHRSEGPGSMRVERGRSRLPQNALRQGALHE